MFDHSVALQTALKIKSDHFIPLAFDEDDPSVQQPDARVLPDDCVL